MTNIKLDRVSTPLIPMYGPHGKLGSCGLGVPGDWFPLQHRLRDVDRNARDIGMLINVKKTNMIIFNTKTSRQVIPFCSLTDGEPLPLVSKMRMLGLILDSGLTWWPLVEDLIRRCSAKIWSLVKLREVGAHRDQLTSL